MVVQSALLIPLLACIPVSLRRLGLAAHGLIRRAAVGRVFLVGNDLSLIVQFQAGRTEVVAELVADELRRRGVVARRIERARLHQGDALLVVHDVQRLALQRGRVHANRAIMTPVDLEAAEVDPLFDEIGRFLPHLAHALARGVIDIVGRAATAQVGLAQLVAVVPVHVGGRMRATQMRHTNHVAVGVVDVALRDRVAVTDRRAAQAIADLEQGAAGAVFDQTRFAVGVGARPAGMDRVAAAMPHLQEVAHGVVHVALDVGAHGIAVVG